MLIATVDIPYVNPSRWGGTSSSLRLLLQCDTCNKSFLRKKCVKVALKRQQHYCTSICARRSTETKNKSKLTSLLRYGVDHPMKSASFLNHMRNCHIAIYGVDHPRKAESVKQKIAQKTINTNRTKYGVDYGFQSSEIQQKCRDTMLSRYGVQFFQHRIDYAERLNNYGDIHKIKHWKSEKVLTCRALYEVAFVNWCNYSKIDFDWQIRVKTPFKTSKNNDVFYFVDAFIKDGTFTSTWIEIKGYFHNSLSKKKWEWFHSMNPNSQLWDRDRLEELDILVKGKPNVTYQNI